MIRCSPPSTTTMQLLVVPRSIPHVSMAHPLGGLARHLGGRRANLSAGLFDRSLDTMVERADLPIENLAKRLARLVLVAQLHRADRALDARDLRAEPFRQVRRLRLIAEIRQPLEQ